MRNDLRNISTKKLFALQTERFEQYHNTLKHLKAKPILKGKEAKPIESLTFGEVISIRHNLQNPTIDGIFEVFNLVFGLNRKELLKANVIQFYHAFNWVQEQILSITKREQKKLTSSPDEKLKSAGIEDLNIFGELNTLIALGEKFGKAPQEVEKWTYSFVFSLMYHDKISSDINKRYTKLLTKK
jgi:hypothetical protein